MAKKSKNVKSSLSNKRSGYSGSKPYVKRTTGGSNSINSANANRMSSQSTAGIAAKKPTGTPLAMKLMYAFMLLLLLAGGASRVATKNIRKPATVEPTPLQSGSPSQSLPARVLIFHREGGVDGVCDDLVVTAAGAAVLSACAGGDEQQYQLSTIEKQQLNSWLGAYKPFDYDSGKPANPEDMITKLSLNGHGEQVASEVDLQQFIGFATKVETEISTQQ